MSALGNNPTNKNFLSPLGFRFSIKRAPHVNYFVQSVSIPNISLGSTSVPTPFSRIPVAGDHLLFGPFNVSFKVDEDLANYLEIYNWLIKIGFPDNFEQYRALDNNNPTADAGTYSDLTLIVLSSSKNPTYEINFVDAYPTSLTDIVFDTRTPDVDYVECTATFDYRKFSITAL